MLCQFNARINLKIVDIFYKYINYRRQTNIREILFDMR
jgi:hypothetical protein